jgi:flagellar basal body-associated protein FliL
MAIIIQEDKKKGAIIPLIAGSVVLVAAAFFAYYLFFSPVPIVDVIGTPGFETTETFSQAKLDVESVINSPVWTSLQRESQVPPLVTQIISEKTNLFQSFEAQ